MLVEKFTYPTLKRVTAKNGQRQYTGDESPAHFHEGAVGGIRHRE